MSESSSTTAASPGAASTGTAAASTFGQSVDAEIVLLKSRIAHLEASAKTDWSAALTWAKGNWAHIVLTWPAAVTVLKPVVVDLLKLL